jgi:hypothetical protein
MSNVYDDVNQRIRETETASSKAALRARIAELEADWRKERLRTTELEALLREALDVIDKGRSLPPANPPIVDHEPQRRKRGVIHG